MEARFHRCRVEQLRSPDRYHRYSATSRLCCRIFRAIADEGVTIDLVLQCPSPVAGGRTDLTFTCQKDDAARALKALRALHTEIGYRRAYCDSDICKVSIFGAGMRSHPGVVATFCEALANDGVNIKLISTSEVRISVLIQEGDSDTALRALHNVFGLMQEPDATSDARQEAVVNRGSAAALSSTSRASLCIASSRSASNC